MGRARNGENCASRTAAAREGSRRRIDVYFAGDSITRRWGATDGPEFLANWTRTSSAGTPPTSVGRGHGQNILWRLHNGELDNVHPPSSSFWQGPTTSGNMSRDGEALLTTSRTASRRSWTCVEAPRPRSS